MTVALAKAQSATPTSCKFLTSLQRKFCPIKYPDNLFIQTLFFLLHSEFPREFSSSNFIFILVPLIFFWKKLAIKNVPASVLFHTNMLQLNLEFFLLPKLFSRKFIIKEIYIISLFDDTYFRLRLYYKFSLNHGKVKFYFNQGEELGHFYFSSVRVCSLNFPLGSAGCHNPRTSDRGEREEETPSVFDDRPLRIISPQIMERATHNAESTLKNGEREISGLSGPGCCTRDDATAVQRAALENVFHAKLRALSRPTARSQPDIVCNRHIRR